MRTDTKFLRSRLGVLLIAGGAVFVFGREPYRPVVDPANFQAKVNHPYFPLVPGTTRKYRETAGGETTESEITVTGQTKEIMGVKCVVVHEVVIQNEALKEESWDWYAQDKQGAVWCFGQVTEEKKAYGGISHEGSWEAGVDGAQPGIIMPAAVQPGKPYRQEYLAGKAEDMGQIVATNETVTVPAGNFGDCVKTKEWSLLESGTEYKWYGRGAGIVRTQATAGEIAILLSIKRP